MSDQVNEVSAQTTVVATATPERRRFNDAEFVQACVQSTNVAELAKLTGLTVTTCNQRRSQLRGKGWPIPEYKKGATGQKHTGPTDADFETMAKVMGKTVEEVKALSAETSKKYQERSNKVRNGKAATANAANTEATSEPAKQ